MSSKNLHQDISKLRIEQQDHAVVQHTKIELSSSFLSDSVRNAIHDSTYSTCHIPGTVGAC